LKKSLHMPSSVSWYQDSSNVILAVSYEDLSKAEVLQQLDEILAMLDTVDHPVFICHDLRYADRKEQIKIRELIAVARHPVVVHPNRAFSYFINPSRRAEIIIDLANRILPTTVQRYKLVHTMDEALRDINQRISQKDKYKDKTR